MEARREGKGGGGLQQPLPFVLALNAGPKATVALRDLWIQEQGEDKSRGRDTRGDQSGRQIGRTPAPHSGITRTRHVQAFPAQGDGSQQAAAGWRKGPKINKQLWVWPSPQSDPISPGTLAADLLCDLGRPPPLSGPPAFSFIKQEWDYENTAVLQRVIDGVKCCNVD